MTTLADLRSQYPDLDGLDDEQAVDALHQAFYADLPREKLASALGVKPAPPAPEKSSLARRAAGDTGISLLKGAIGVPEAVVGLADIPTGGRVGKFLENEGGAVGFRPKEARQMLDTYLSPEQQEANRKVQEADGFVDTAVTALRNPSTIVQGAIESAPAMLGGGVLARGAMKLAPKMSAFAAAGIGEGAVSMGQTAEQIRQETPDGLLTGKQALIAAGSGTATGALGAIAGRAAKALGIGDIDTMIAGGAKGSTPDLQKGFVRKVLEGVVSEGVLEELPQSVQEQVAQNWALGKPLDEGVDHAAVMGMLSGGLMGGGAQAFHSPGAVPHVEEVGPLSRAANVAIDTSNVEAAVAAAQPVVEPVVAPVAVPGAAQFAQAGVRPAGDEAALGRMHQRAADDAQQLREFGPSRASAPVREAPPVETDAEPVHTDGDILNKSGAPFSNRAAVVRAQKALPNPEGYVIASVKGGFVLRQLAQEQASDAGLVESPDAGRVDGAGVADAVGADGNGGVVSGELPGAGAAGTVAEPAPDVGPHSGAGGAGSAAVAALTERETEAVSRETIPSATEPAHEAATSPTNDLPEPTQAQKEAGNYRKGHIKIGSLDISVENPMGSERKGVDRDGKPWSNTMQSHYGYVRGTQGNDKDHFDLFVKDGTPADFAGPVFIVDQVHPDTKTFDEHKALVGFDTIDEAKAAYRANYADDWKGMQAVTTMPMREFEQWVKDGPKNAPLVPITTRKAEPTAAPEPAPAVAPSAAAPASEDHGAWWTRATAAERGAALLDAGWTGVNGRPGLNAQNLAKRAWNDLKGSQRARIEAARDQRNTPQPAAGDSSIVANMESGDTPAPGKRETPPAAPKPSTAVAPSPAPAIWDVIDAATEASQGGERLFDINTVVDDDGVAHAATDRYDKAPRINLTAKTLSLDVDNPAPHIGDAADGSPVFQDDGGMYYMFDEKAQVLRESADRPPMRGQKLPKDVLDAFRGKGTPLATPDDLLPATPSVEHIGRLQKVLRSFDKNIHPDAVKGRKDINDALMSLHDGRPADAVNMLERASNRLHGQFGLQSETVAEIAEAIDAAQAAPADDKPTIGPAVEPEPAKADTEAKEPAHDPAPQGDSTPVDQPLAEGPATSAVQAVEPVRGARQPRERAGRKNARGVRESGGLFEGVDDAGGDVGDRAGPDVVSDRSDDAVAGGRERVSAPDFRPAAGALTRQGSWFETARRNIDLIDLARKIESEKRPATPEEQAQLAKYVGFGAGEIRNALFPVPSSYAKAQEPNRLIWPDYVRDARWKPLAERLEALPIEWQRSVLQSSQYAHYTSEGIIRAVWSGLQRLGFTGGKVLEPGMGIGSFAMLMPDTVRKTSKYTGIEFDGPTALIARLLSPQQHMLHDDFIKRKLPRDYFDVAIGNPPFSQTKVLGDPDYEKHGFMLHDFFFAKALDRVRPGGVLAFVTSKGTMDKQSDKARKFMADRADLMGAIRLPSTAFEGNAGTSVVTDVIFLRKRLPGEEPAGHAWNGLATIETKDGEVAVNEYFAANPAMVLGQQRISGNTDDEGRRINSNGMGGEKYTVVSYDKTPGELDAKFAAAIERLPENAYSAMRASSTQLRAETAKVDFDPKVKREGVVYVADDGTLMRVENGVGKALDAGVRLSEKDKAWFKSYVGIRDLVQEARAAQVADGDWAAALRRLNKAYDTFRKEHGPINDFRVQVRKSTDEEGNPVETDIRIFKNRRLFREDYDSSIVTQLETINEAGEVVKAPFLKDRTIGKPKTREVRTVGDALAVSLDENGVLDLDDVAKRGGVTRAEAIDALGSQVYQTPQGQWQLSDEYLSGDVVAKLEEAEHAARDNPALARNVEALKAVQPERLGPSQIAVKLGASWVPASYVTEFAKEIGAGTVKFDPLTESWQVEGGNERSQRRAGAEYGTAARSASELLEAALNSRSIVVKTKTEDKKEVTDAEATTAAMEMAKKIKDKFKSWIWTDSERAATLVDAYNTRFNNIAPRRFDGSHLTLPGVSLRYKLHPHQLRAIWRQIQTGDVYLAHAVGAGKTIEMIAGGMEQKRLGLIRKPIYAVPNHMLEQFANEFMELYPLANIMVADDENFSAERRKAFVAAATLNAPDAIIITHSAFERIGVKEETVEPIRDEILSELEMAMAEVAKDKGERVRRAQLEQQIEAVTQRFDRIIGSGSKDSTIKFEDIGADYVYVDEAHAFRKLDFTTNQRIKGIDPSGSKRSLDMYVKTRYLQKQRPGRAMAFASGTPVTNTMGELYTIMRFFAPEELARAGITQFDSWARQFGEAVASLEANAAGRYETVERFAKFDNVPELMSRVRQFMDVLTSEHLGALVKRPDVEGGKPNLITVEPTPDLKLYMKTELLPRLEKSRRWKPSKDQPFNPDPVIAITSDGRFASLDPRFFGAHIDEDTTPTKLTKMADRIAETYAATADNAYTDRDGKPEAIKGSTQIVFYNLGFGEQSQKNRGFNARAALTKRLTDKGVKRDQIAWFDDADTDAKKEAIFKKMRSGELRVLIGSAKKMGTGVNVQKRLKRLHYFDPPWYPSDVEQPHGRIIRQGNQNDIVGIDWYATKGTYDATMWQMVGRKQRFIDQAFSGDKSLRSMDDMSEASSYEQAAAVASGDPRALQLAGLRQDVERLERLQAAHASEQINVRSALRSAEWNVESFGKRVKTYEKAFAAIGSRYFAFTEGKVGGKSFDKLGDFGQALKEAFNKGAADNVLHPKDTRELATMGPIQIGMDTHFGKKNEPDGTFTLTASIGGVDHSIIHGSGLGSDVDAVGLARRIVNVANSIESQIGEARRQLTSNETDVTRLRKKLGAPFEHTQDLADKFAELKNLEAELKAEGEAEAKEAQRAMDAADAAKRAAPAVNEDGSTSDEALASRAPEAPKGDAPVVRAGLTPEELRAEVAKIMAQWGNAPVGGVTVVESADKLPEDVQRTASADEEGHARAYFYTPTESVYLIADRLPTLADAQFTLFHEVYGHYGLRAVLGDRYAGELMMLRRANQQLAAEASMWFAAYGRDEVAKRVERGMDRLAAEREVRLLSTEEALADRAGEAKPLKGWQRFVAALQKALRKIGLDKLADWMENKSEAETMALLARAREAVQRGTAAPGKAIDSGAPLASRTITAAALQRVADVKLPAGYLVGDLLNSDGKVHWWHKTVGTMHNLAERSPAFKRVYDGVQNFINDVSAYATEAADLAPRILPKLESWRDVLKTPLSAADTKAISAPIFEGTLAWGRDENGKPVKMETLKERAAALDSDEKSRLLMRHGRLDPKVLRMWQGLPIDQFETMVASKYEKELLRPGVVWKDAELKSMFKLTGERDPKTGKATGQIGLYDEFRAAIGKSLSDMAVSEMLRMGKDDTADLRDRVLGMEANKAAEVLRDALFERADSDPARRDALNDTANKMIQIADRAQDLMDRGYAPLSRYGELTLDVIDEKGERVFFSLYESTAERSKAARQMRAAFPGATITQGTISKEGFKLFAGVSPETMELFGEMLGLDAGGDSKSDEAFQKFIKLTKSNRSTLTRLIHRKGIAGFSEDAGRVLAGFVYSNARKTSSNLHMAEIDAAVNDIGQGSGQLKDQAQRLADYVKNPKEEAQAIRGLMFFQYLGGSIASAMVNMTQPVAVTFPYLSQYGGVTKAASRMAAAVKDANKKKTGDTALDAALKHAEETGIVSPQEVHQLMAQAQGKATLKSGDGTLAGNTAARASNVKSKFVLAWGKVFGLAEQFNRRVTFIAAYRTAVAEKIADPAAFAAHAVAETQFTYNKGNKPEWARGAIGSTLFTFKQYSVNYVELLGRMWQSGPDGKKAALLAMAVLFLMSGADGLPFAQDADDLLDALMQRLGYAFSSQQMKQEFFASIIGKDGARFLEHGLSGLPGVPIDVSGRMGLGNLIPGTGLLTKKTDHTRDALEIAGPVADLGKRAFQAAGQLIDGAPVKAITTIAPTAARNVVKAFEMADTGAYNDDRNRKVIDTDLGDALAKGIGFQPTRVARIQEAKRQEVQLIAQAKMRETELADQMAKAIFDKDSEALREARDALTRWNADNPTSRITIGPPQIVKRIRSMREDAATRLARTAPAEIRANVRRALAEATE